MSCKPCEERKKKLKEVASSLFDKTANADFKTVLSVVAVSVAIYAVIRKK